MWPFSQIANDVSHAEKSFHSGVTDVSQAITKDSSQVYSTATKDFSKPVVSTVNKYVAPVVHKVSTAVDTGYKNASQGIDVYGNDSYQSLKNDLSGFTSQINNTKSSIGKSLNAAGSYLCWNCQDYWLFGY